MRVSRVGSLMSFKPATEIFHLLQNPSTNPSTKTIDTFLYKKSSTLPSTKTIDISFYKTIDKSFYRNHRHFLLQKPSTFPSTKNHWHFLLQNHRQIRLQKTPTNPSTKIIEKSLYRKPFLNFSFVGSQVFMEGRVSPMERGDWWVLGGGGD